MVLPLNRYESFTHGPVIWLNILAWLFHIGSSKNLPASGCSCLVVAGIVTVLPFPKTRRAHMSQERGRGWRVSDLVYMVDTRLWIYFVNTTFSLPETPYLKLFFVLPLYKHDFNCPLVSIVWTDCNLFSHLQLLAFLPPSNHLPSDLSLCPFIYKYLSFKTFLNIKNK